MSFYVCCAEGACRSGTKVENAGRVPFAVLSLSCVVIIIAGVSGLGAGS